jgi:sulfate-transporting ATPase
LVVGAVVAGLILVTDGGAQVALVTMAIGAVAILSYVVLVGYAGQVSLAGYALAGIAALVAGRLSETYGWSFPVVALLGVATAALAGLVFGIPALRSRGVTLAIVTLGLGIAVSNLIFTNPSFTGGLSGTKPRLPSLLGIDLASPRNFGVFVVAVAVIVGLVVRNVRAGRVGRRMLAIRSNERAAASLGISVGFVKLYAFVLSAAIVGVAGVLQAFRVASLEYSQFDFSRSLTLVSSALVGGAGYVAGALYGTLMLPNGIVTYWLRNVDNLQDWLLLVGGILLILTLVLNPDGIAHANQMTWRRIRRRKVRPGPTARASRLEPSARLTHLPVRREDATLIVEALTVRFGAVTAVDAISLQVGSGHILGVLGPNGAGKTTLIDAVSGFVRAQSGRVTVNDVDISRAAPHTRNRRGLGRSFQSVELFEDLTVEENLRVADEPHDRAMWVRDLLPRRARPLSPEALRVADSLELTHYFDRMPSEVPHGARSLLGVARAVLTGCPIILLDEPAAGLDERETADLARVLRALVHELNVGLLLVEHHVGMVMAVSDEILVMDFGKQLFRGSCADAVRDDEVRRAYLGLEVA